MRYPPLASCRLLLALFSGGLLLQRVLSNVVSGDDLAPCAAEQQSAPQCRAAFTQVRTKRKAPAPLVANEEGVDAVRAPERARGDGVISSIYYINLNQSMHRRLAMENHLTQLGIRAERIEAVQLEASKLGIFSSSDLAQLDTIFGSWGCGPWAATKCMNPGDKVCCWGFYDALNMTTHTSAAQGKYLEDGLDPTRVRATTFLSNTASFVKALQLIKFRYKASVDPLPAILLEDDARLAPKWGQVVADATRLLPSDWDIVKLYYVPEPSPRQMACVHLCEGTGPCFLKISRHVSCEFFSNAALVINPAHSGKILTAVENTLKRFVEDSWLNATGRHPELVDRAPWGLPNPPKLLKQMYSFDHLLVEAAMAGQINGWVPGTWGAELDYTLDNQSTFSYHELLGQGRYPARAQRRQHGKEALHKREGSAMAKTSEPASADVVGDVYYVNLAVSEDRRVAMESHLSEFGLEPKRVEAVRFDATETGVYSDADQEQINNIFGAWSCGSWTEARCDGDDKVCCWGFLDALNMTTHIQSHTAGRVKHEARATSYFANLASHVQALQQIRDRYNENHNPLPVLLMEDDSRLLDGWKETVLNATRLLPEDWDIVKLFYELPPLAAPPASCKPLCESDRGNESLCFLRMTGHWECEFWSCAALLVNPAHAEKFLTALEHAHMRYAEDAWLRRTGQPDSPDRGKWPMPINDTYLLKHMYSVDYLGKTSAVAGELNGWAPSRYAANLDLALDAKSTLDLDFQSKSGHLDEAKQPEHSSFLGQGTQVRSKGDDVVSGMYYINLEQSHERREAMEHHLSRMGLNAERVDAVKLEASERGNFSDADLEQLNQVFKSWKCGAWAETKCAPDDKVCCWGFQDALNYTRHIQSHWSGNQWNWVRSTTFLSNTASFYKALQLVRDRYEEHHNPLPVLLMEDDARLAFDWQETVANASKLLPEDWDYVKFYYYPWDGWKRLHCDIVCPSTFNPETSMTGADEHDAEQCFFKAGRDEMCKFFSNAAILVNPKHAEKMLAGIASAHYRYTEDSWLMETGVDLKGVDRGTWDDPYWLLLNQMYCFDHILAFSSAAGVINGYASMRYGAEPDWDHDHVTTFNLGQVSAEAEATQIWPTPADDSAEKQG